MSFSNIPLVAHSIDGFVTKDQFWRLERIGSLGRSPLSTVSNVFVSTISTVAKRSPNDDAKRTDITIPSNDRPTNLFSTRTQRDIRRCHSVTLSGKHLLQDWSSRLVVENRLIGGGS